MRWLLFFIFTAPAILNAQSVINFNCDDYEKKKECTCKSGKDFSTKTVLDQIQIGNIQDVRFTACYYHLLGNKYYYEDDHVKAIQHYKKAIDIRKKYDDGLLWKSYQNLGYEYYEAGYYEKAIEFVEKALEENNVPKRKETNLYNSLSRSYTAIGEYEEAVNTAKRAIKLANDSISKGTAHQQLCITFVETQDSLNRAIEEADKAIGFFEGYNEDLASAYNNKGNALRWLGRYDEAIQVYKNALKKYPKTNKLDHAATLNNIATALFAKEKYFEAIKILNQSLQLKKDSYENTPYHLNYAINYENLAENHEALGNKNEAMKNYQLALINLTDNFRNQDINTNPKVIGRHYIYNKPDLLRVLDLKAQAALKSGNIDLAYKIYEDLDNWINEFYKDLSTNASKLTWIARAHATYAHAIEVALEKGEKEKAFQYAEKAHAVLLWQSLSQQAARSLLSEEDKDKMDDLTAQIRQADRQYRNGEIQINTLRRFEREQEELENTFEKEYPEYAQRKYQPEATTVHDIQSKIIDDKTAFIEYYQTNEVLYIFTITKNGLKITQKSADGLAGDISNFVKSISRKNMDLETYHALAHKLYKRLIPENLSSNERIKSLIIVPDRDIGTLPFAALSTQQASGKPNKDTPFLVKKYATNYLYSAGSYLQLQQKKADQRYCFAGIAPVDYQDKNWKSLPYAEKELDGMESFHYFWNKEILKRAAATKAAFMQIIGAGYHTILVSTHAVFDKNGGQIIFHDSALSQDEIDQLEIDTHRLILSACETGVGVQNQGEGVLSLGWNFVYKGVPSITMTHWKVNEYSTQKIMVTYHEKLNGGIPADKALQIAMLDFLNNEELPDASLYAPYYWAASFHTGNVR